MMYVNGLGYVEDPTTLAVPSSSVRAYHPRSESTGFDTILNSYTTESNGRTYTLKQIFEKAADTFGLSEKLLEAVTYRESGFDVNSTSSTGAGGLMQLMPGTAAELGVTDVYDAYQNIMGGARYLKQLYDRFSGDLSLTLAAYNAGPGAVSRAGGIPSESVGRYVSSILGMLDSGKVTVPDVTVTVGSADSTTEKAGTATAAADSDSSLADLYALGVSQQTGMAVNTTSATADAIAKAARAYAAGAGLLDI